MRTLRRIAPLAVAMILGAGSYWWVTSDLSPDAVYLCTHLEYREFITRMNRPGIFLGALVPLPLELFSGNDIVGKAYTVNHWLIWLGILTQWAAIGLLVSWILERILPPKKAA